VFSVSYVRMPFCWVSEDLSSCPESTKYDFQMNLLGLVCQNEYQTRRAETKLSADARGETGGQTTICHGTTAKFAFYK
jgi:hypothetical protein